MASKSLRVARKSSDTVSSSVQYNVAVLKRAASRRSAAAAPGKAKRGAPAARSGKAPSNAMKSSWHALVASSLPTPPSPAIVARKSCRGGAKLPNSGARAGSDASDFSSAPVTVPMSAPSGSFCCRQRTCIPCNPLPSARASAASAAGAPLTRAKAAASWPGVWKAQRAPSGGLLVCGWAASLGGAWSSLYSTTTPPPVRS
eukprot:scaffold40_cov66-Phaeocystis_antarctica.AAC.12